MPLAASGFEEPTAGYYLSRGWVANGESTSRYVHRDRNGFGGRYAIATPVSTPIVSNTARWFHFWFHRGTNLSWSNGFSTSVERDRTSQFTVRIQSDGSIQLRRGSFSGALVATSSGNMDMTKGHWVAVEMTVQNSGGVCNVYVDDDVTAFVSFTGDTQATNSFGTNWNSVQFGAAGAAWVDDVILTDAAEGQYTETFGRRVALTSDAATALTPSAGSDNYKNVESFDSTSYNAGTTAATEDLYGARGNLRLGAIDFVSLEASVASQNDFQMQSALKSGATTSYGTLQAGGPGSYAPLPSLFLLTDPDTASAWTAEGVNAMQAGVRTGT